MIVTCDACGTSFNFDEKMLKPTGSKMRCSKCQSIFVAYPPAESPPQNPVQAEPNDSMAAAGIAGGLDDLDLDEIEKELDLDLGTTEEFESAEQSDLDFPFDGDQEDSDAPGRSTDDVEQEALDISELGLDPESGESSSDEEDGQFDLDVNTAGGIDSRIDIAAADVDDELNFDLDFGDQAEEATDAEGALDFNLDLDLDDPGDTDRTPAEPQEEGAGDLEDLSLDLADNDSGNSNIEFDETGDLDLLGEETDAADADSDDDLDFSFDLDEDAQSTDMSADEDAGFDFQSEDASADGQSESSDDDPDLSIALDGSDESDIDMELEGSEEPVDFDLDLDFDSEAEAETPTSGSGKLEETDEIDLADLEGMIEDGAPGSSAEDQGAEDDDLDLSLEDEENADSSAEETDELDLSSLEEALDDEGQDAGEAADEELSDLLDIESDSGEADAELELDDVESASASGDSPDAETGSDEEEFDIASLDDLLELDEEDSGAEGDQSDFDLELEFDDDASGETAEEELEEPEPEPAVAAAAFEEAVVEQQPSDEGFDMSPLDGDDDSEAFFDDEESQASPVAGKRRRGLGGLVKVLLVLILLGGGGFAAVYLSDYFGVEIPYMDTVKDSVRKVPYVGELFGPAVEDPGNLNFSIPENEVTGYFIQNQKLGQLYVIEGKARNLYDTPRRFVRITGKLYAGGRKLQNEKTVFAGNVLTEKELAGLDQAAIDKLLANRFGRSKANVEIEKGGTIPFMLVFSNLGSNLDEYTVEVADSVAVKKKP